MRRRAVSGIGVLLLGVALAMAPVLASPAAAKPKHHKVVKHNSPATAKLSGSDCTALNGEQTQSSKLASTLEQAFASGNFATIKSAMLAEFTTDGQDVSKVEALLSSAPANVKAAFATVTLGPGNVNFTPSGSNVTANNQISGTSTPNPCTDKWVTF